MSVASFINFFKFSSGSFDDQLTGFDRVSTFVWFFHVGGKEESECLLVAGIQALPSRNYLLLRSAE